MLIKLVGLRENEEAALLDVARKTCSQGKESIYHASDLLPAKGKKEVSGTKG